MRKPPTGEPCAGKPPARFGGRGGREPFPTPMLCRSTWDGQEPAEALIHHLAHALGRTVHTLQWDRARPVFEASTQGSAILWRMASRMG